MATTRRNMAKDPRVTAGFLVDAGTGGTASVSYGVAITPPATFPATEARATWSVGTSAVSGLIMGGLWTGFTQGLPYSFTMVVRCSKIQRVRADVSWYTSGASFISTSTGAEVVLAAGTATLITLANVTAPTGAARMRLFVSAVPGTSAANWVAADTLGLSGVVIEQLTTTTTQYFDGSTAAGTYGATNKFAWEGVVNASASVQLTPVLSLTAAAEPGNNPPRVALSLDMSDAGGSPIPTEATIVRVDPDGRQRPVRLAEPAALLAGIWQGYDYESPFGQAVTYQATGDALTVDSSPVTLDVAVPWLRHPGVPSLSVPIPVDHFRKDSLATRSRATSRATFEPMGRATPIVVVTAGARRAINTAMAIRTDTELERTAMWDIVEDESVLLLDIPPGLAWGVTHEYVSIGDVDETRLADWGAQQSRWFGLPYIVVDRPAGGLQAQFTYTDVLADHLTYADVRARFDSYADLLANRRNDA